MILLLNNGDSVPHCWFFINYLQAFVVNFPLATNEFYRNKEGEQVGHME